MIDTETTNQSFINMWHLLQDMNVDNNDFMLTLNHDQAKEFILKRNDGGVVSPQMKLVLINEMKSNVWFFFREYIIIEDSLSSAAVSYNHRIHNTYNMHFILNPVTLAMIYLYDHHKNFIVDDSIPGVKLCMALLYYYEKVIKNNDVKTFNHELKTYDVNENTYLSVLDWCDNITQSILFTQNGLPTNKEFIVESLSHYLVDTLTAPKKTFTKNEKSHMNIFAFGVDTTIENLSFSYELFEPYKKLSTEDISIYMTTSNINYKNDYVDKRYFHEIPDNHLSEKENKDLSDYKFRVLTRNDYISNLTFLNVTMLDELCYIYDDSDLDKRNCCYKLLGKYNKMIRYGKLYI